MKNFEIAINERVIEAINAILSSGLALNKADLAEKFGIKPAKFSEILNKRMKAGMDIIQNLCIDYEISADWLITGEGSMYRSPGVMNEAPPPDRDEVVRLLREKVAIRHILYIQQSVMKINTHMAIAVHNHVHFGSSGHTYVGVHTKEIIFTQLAIPTTCYIFVTLLE